LDQWRTVLRTELKPERLIEAVEAMTAFGRNGQGKEAVEALLALGARYVPPPSPRSQRTDERVMIAVQQALSDSGAPAIPILVRGARSENAKVRALALRVLAYTPNPTREMSEVLMAATTDKDAAVRRSAVWSLAAAPDKGAAIAALKKALQDSDAQVRATALGAYFGRQDVSRDDRLDAAYALLKDADPEVRDTAISVVQQLNGDLAKVVRSQMGLFVGATKLEEKNAILMAFRRLGPSAADALPMLKEFSNSPETSPHLRQAVQTAINAIEGRSGGFPGGGSFPGGGRSAPGGNKKFDFKKKFGSGR
jgi:HEAT repeat protein